MTARVPTPSRTPAQLREVLTGRQVADPGARRAAAIELARTNDPRAQDALIAALRSERDPRVRTGIVKALGWIGDANAYAPLVAAGATFAARLVAHRHGLTVPDLAALDLPEKLPPPQPATAKTIELAIPSAEAARICLASVATRSFGLPIDEQGLRVLRCDRTEWMLLVNRDLARPDALLAKRAIPFALALFMPETASYSISHLALATPPDALVVCRTTGAPVFAGPWHTSSDGLRVSLAALVRPGAFPVDVTAHHQHGVVSMDRAVYGPIAVPKLVPGPFDLRSAGRR